MSKAPVMFIVTQHCQNAFDSAQFISLVTTEFRISLVSNGARCRPDYKVSCTYKHKVPECYVTCTDLS
jgi:hypothetical protein